MVGCGKPSSLRTAAFSPKENRLANLFVLSRLSELHNPLFKACKDASDGPSRALSTPFSTGFSALSVEDSVLACRR
jgi:hypothetical protein